MLAKLISPDNADRKSAEAALKQFEDGDPSHYLLELALISTAQEDLENPATVRQLAANLLRQYVEEHGGEQGRSGESMVNTEVKKKLVEILLPSLNVGDAEIRDSNAHIVATVIKQNWQSMWEKVLPVLRKMMNTTDNDKVLSSLKVVSGIFDGTFYDEVFLKCSYSLLPSVAQLIFSPQTSDNSRVHARNFLPPYIKLMTRFGGSTFVDEVRSNFKRCELSDLAEVCVLSDRSHYYFLV